MLHAVDAERFADARVGRLSGGEQQRVLIAHALIGRPSCCSWTSRSPTSTSRSGQEVVALLDRIAEEQQIAVLLSAHEMNPLLPVMDRIVYLAGGRAASGTTDEVVRDEVLSALYGHEVHVHTLHGRILVVAGPMEEPALPADPASRRSDRALGVRAGLLLEPARARRRASSGAIVAVVSAVVGVFTVMRGQSFAGHSLADVATAGGSGAFLLGINPLFGFVAGGVVGAGAMEMIGVRRARGRDLATGIVLGASIGLAALFLYLGTTRSSTTGASQQILFGSIFSTDSSTVPIVAIFSVVCAS